VLVRDFVKLLTRVSRRSVIEKKMQGLRFIFGQINASCPCPFPSVPSVAAAAAAAVTTAAAFAARSAATVCVFVGLLSRLTCALVGENSPALRLIFAGINPSCPFRSVSSSIVAAATRVFVSIGMSSLEGRERETEEFFVGRVGSQRGRVGFLLN
jgi:hypothetical protein